MPNLLGQPYFLLLLLQEANTHNATTTNTGMKRRNENIFCIIVLTVNE